MIQEYIDEPVDPKKLGEIYEAVKRSHIKFTNGSQIIISTPSKDQMDWFNRCFKSDGKIKYQRRVGQIRR